MSERPISKGDLVMVVRLRWCCGGGRLGAVKVVQSSDDMRPGLPCKTCKCIRFVDHVRVDDGWIETSRLKRIDPPAEQETREIEKELEK